MKKLILFTFSFLLSFCLTSQNIESIVQVPPKYLKLLPTGTDPSKIKPSDIPSETVLRQMGFSDAEVSQAMDFKNSRGEYNKVNNGNSNEMISLDQLNDIQVRKTINFKDTIVFPKQRIFGQDILRYTQINFFDLASDAKAPENYKIGSGDEISISVWGFSEFSETLLVDDRGYINPSSYGRIYVQGLTFKKTRSLLKTRFASFLDMKNSEIDITLSYSKVITVNIVGEVFYPGSYSIPSINTAFNALVAARGPNQLGTVRNIYIKRDGVTVDSLDIYKFLFNPTVSRDIYMQDGDYLFVPPAGKIVEIKGEVNRPYKYEVKSGETIDDLIKYAGGYTTTAFSDVLTLNRIEYNSLKVYDVYKDHTSSTVINNGDIINVNAISNKLSNYVEVKGSVGATGYYEFIKGEKLLTLLNRAKCIDEKTFLDKVYVIRLNEDRTKKHITLNLGAIIKDSNHEDNIWMQEYDIVSVLSLDNFDEHFSVSIYGAVRSNGQFDFGDGMTLQDIILQAGGLKMSAEDSRIEISRVTNYDLFTKKVTPVRAIVKTIKVGKDLMLSEDARDFALHPLDQVFVRSNADFNSRKNVKIAGEVMYKGLYTILEDNETIASLISRAGGLTNFAHTDGAILYRKFQFVKDETQEILIPEGDLLDTINNTPGINNLYNLEIIKDLENNNISLALDTFIAEPIYFNLKKALKYPTSKHNLVLSEGDSLHIPLKLDVVTIKGALNNIEGNSISTPFLGKRANYYVRNYAGGYTEGNKKSRTVVMHANGAVKKSVNFGLFSISPRVKPGSTIKVMNSLSKKRKKKDDIDYNKHIESIIIKVTAIMSLYLLIDRVNNSY